MTPLTTAPLPPEAEPTGDHGRLPEIPPEAVPDLDRLLTVTEEPVDSIFAEKQQRLLTEPLYSSWPGPGEDRPFLALANVGYFHGYRQPPVVPDVLLSLDVEPAGDLHTREGHSYFEWLMDKAPDVIIEIVSDRRGGEESHKQRLYARRRILYYVIFDPENHLGHGVLRAFAWQAGQYAPVPPAWLEQVGLGLTLWTGTYEKYPDTWLRWCDQQGQVIPTGAERAEQAEQLRDDAVRRAERLAERLRALGQDPDT